MRQSLSALFACAGFALLASACTGDSNAKEPPLTPEQQALADGRWQEALDLCAPDPEAGASTCDARWCEALARFGLVMAEIDAYVLPTFRSGDPKAFQLGQVDTQRLVRLWGDMGTLSDRIEPIVQDRCSFRQPTLPFRFGDAEDPVAQGEFRGTWTPRSALFIGSAMDSVRYIFTAIAGGISAPAAAPGEDPALPAALGALRTRLLAFDQRLFSEPASKDASGGGWYDTDGDGAVSHGDELLVDLFEPGTERRVFDFAGAELVRGEALPLEPLVSTAEMPAARCGYAQWHIDTLYDQNVGTTDGLSFSNDGQTIAFPMRVFNAYQIHLANLDGTNVRCLTCDQRPLGWNDGVRWQPRGDHFVFVSTRDHPYAVGGAGGGFGQELYAMRSDGSEPTRLTTSGAWATNYHVNWSHDGKRVVWGTTQKHTWDVMVADFVDDARGMRLENAQRITHDTSWWETHDFTLDGKSIITTNTRAGLESTDIYAIELSSGKRRRLTSHMAWDEHAHLSPDGRKLSWISGRFNPASVARFTDGALSPAYDFFWIGPGIYFNFLAPPVGFTTELTLMNTDGTELIPLTQDHEVVADNVWSPDAKRILFRQTPTATDKTAKIRLLTFDDCR